LLASLYALVFAAVHNATKQLGFTDAMLEKKTFPSLLTPHRPTSAKNY
jgi:hypothetical protein